MHGFVRYCTISTVSSRIMKICCPRRPKIFLLSSSNLKRGLFFWLWCVTELTVEMVQYPTSHVHHSHENESAGFTFKCQYRYKLHSRWPEMNISPSAMYKHFRVAFLLKVLVISAMAARWLAIGILFLTCTYEYIPFSTIATPLFCKCRTGGKPDNDMTSSCCNNGMPGSGVTYGLYYSSLHHRVCIFRWQVFCRMNNLYFSAIARTNSCMTINLRGLTVAAYLVMVITAKWGEK